MRAIVPLLVYLAVAAGAEAGGSPERVIAIGDDGRWAGIGLGAAESSFLHEPGPQIGRPPGGFLRIYPLFGELPGLPGRFYPSTPAICWDQPNAPGRTGPCYRAPARTARLLRSLQALPVSRGTTHAIRVDQCGVDTGLTNLAFGIELAFERGHARPSTFPVQSVQVEVIWRGPQASRRPRTVFVTPVGVFARGKTYAAPRGVWEFAKANLAK